MVTINIDPQGMGDLNRRLSTGGVKARISMNEGLRAIGRLTVPVLKQNTPTGVTRRLRNTTRFQVLQTGLDQRLEIRQGARSGAGFFYGRVVRVGRRAGAKRPPVSALETWVQKKLGVPASRSRSVAFLVARKIGQKGIKANPYHIRTLAQIRPRLQREVTAMGRRVVVHLARG